MGEGCRLQKHVAGTHILVLPFTLCLSFFHLSRGGSDSSHLAGLRWKLDMHCGQVLLAVPDTQP